VQQEAKLASIQRDMRLAPLEDPTVSRGVALSRALAKELSLLFLSVTQKACFAQFAAAAAQHGLLRVGLPQRLLLVSEKLINNDNDRLIVVRTETLIDDDDDKDTFPSKASAIVAIMTNRSRV